MLNVFDLQNRELFESIQGNILKAHGRPHTANLFIRCNDGQQTDARAWLNSLVKDAIVQSGYAQLRSNVLWKEKCVDTGLFACIHISAAGYDYLSGKGTSNRFSDTSFQKGMKNADRDAGSNDPKINDPTPENWEAGLREDNHFMLLLASTNVKTLTESTKKAAQAIPPFGRITTIEKGEALFNKEKVGIEHFGYVDGVSQPLFFDDEWTDYQIDNNIQEQGAIQFDPRAEKELVLVQDPFITDDPNALGSYFVFRKLEQNVRGFKQAEADLANQLGLMGEVRERAGAMLIGRFEDGSPIQISKEEGLIHSAVSNNFDYAVDDASKCPFHAHIRKTNPRSGLKDGGMAEAKKHIMARRAIPFGTRVDDPNDGQLYNKPESGVGLLFMSYQASIINQFEFIQKNWSNNPNSPHLNPEDPDGLDFVIGQGEPRVAGAYATEWGNTTMQRPPAFDQFVHMKGGEYFFAPSMSFLRNIDTIFNQRKNTFSIPYMVNI